MLAVYAQTALPCLSLGCRQGSDGGGAQQSLSAEHVEAGTTSVTQLQMEQQDDVASCTEGFDKQTRILLDARYGSQ